MSATPLSSARDRWIAERHITGAISARTATLFRYRMIDLERIHGNRPVAELDAATLKRWARAVGRFAPGTRRSYQSTVIGFCRWLVAEGLVAEDPTVGLPRQREPRRVPRARTGQEAALLLAAASDARDRAVVWLMLGLGLRSIEVSRLEVADWDRAAQTMLIRGKGAHERMLPVPAGTAQAVGAYRETVGWRPGPLICAIRSASTPLTSHGVQSLVTGMLRRSGVKQAARDGVTPHTLRHTAASDVLDRCGNVRTVQVMLGHSSLATTQVYLRRASLGQLREAMDGRDYGQSVVA